MRKISSVLVFLLVSGCKPDLTDGGAFSGGSSHYKELSQPAINGNDAVGKKVVVKGKYLVRVALHPIGDNETSQIPTLQGLQDSAKGCICVGPLYLNIKDDFSLEFPDSRLKCSLIGDMDLAKLLAGMDDHSDREKAAESSDKMLRLKKLGPMTFTPPRPLLVGPISQDPEEFRGLTETKNYEVEYKDKDKGTIINDNGTIQVNVMESGGSLTPLFMPNRPFDSILRFELLSSGFKKVPRTKGFLFDRVEFALNSRPLAIPMIKLESQASDLMAAAPSDPSKPSIANSGFAKIIASFMRVYIRLDATSFETN